MALEDLVSEIFQINNGGLQSENDEHRNETNKPVNSSSLDT